MKGKIKMEYIKKVFRSYWILSIFCVVLGIALIIDPNFFTAAIGYVIGGLFTAFGAVELIRYFAMGRDDQSYSSSLVRGIILAAIGIFIIIRPDFIPKVIAVVCGLYMLISGIVNIQDSLNLRRAGVESWNVSCISAAVTTLVGILLLFDPLILGETAMIVLGIALLVSGVTNIFGCFTAGSKLKKVNKLMKKEFKDRPDKDHYIDI